MGSRDSNVAIFDPDAEVEPPQVQEELEAAEFQCDDGQGGPNYITPKSILRSGLAGCTVGNDSEDGRIEVVLEEYSLRRLPTTTMVHPMFSGVKRARSRPRGQRWVKQEFRI